MKKVNLLYVEKSEKKVITNRAVKSSPARGCHLWESTDAHHPGSFLSYFIFISCNTGTDCFYRPLSILLMRRICTSCHLSGCLRLFFWPIPRSLLFCLFSRPIHHLPLLSPVIPPHLHVLAIFLHLYSAFFYLFHILLFFLYFLYWLFFITFCTNMSYFLFYRVLSTPQRQ